MKNKKLIGIALILIIFGFIFIPKILYKLKHKEIVDSNRTKKIHTNALSFIKLKEEAKKVPEFAFINQDSIWISNEDYLGKVYLVEFFFTRCPSICIEMNKNMKHLDSIFGDRNDFGIVSISIDPEYDTPIVLKKYQQFYNIKSKYWNFLTGEKEKIYNLANNKFNVFASINPNIEGGFEHQGYFALIDKNGFIRSRNDDYGNPIVYYLGITDENTKTQGVTMLVDDITKLLKE